MRAMCFYSCLFVDFSFQFIHDFNLVLRSVLWRFFLWCINYFYVFFSLHFNSHIHEFMYWHDFKWHILYALHVIRYEFHFFCFFFFDVLLAKVHFSAFFPQFYASFISFWLFLPAFFASSNYFPCFQSISFIHMHFPWRIFIFIAHSKLYSSVISFWKMLVFHYFHVTDNRHSPFGNALLFQELLQQLICYYR